MRKGLLINLDRCSGCDSCIVACKLENDLPLGHFYNKVIAVGPTGTFPNVEKYWLPSQCQQCENPACVHVCPTAASYRDPETGMVLIDKEKCIGCQYCIYACPYGVRQFNEDAGVVQKCTLCAQITARRRRRAGLRPQLQLRRALLRRLRRPGIRCVPRAGEVPGGGHPHAARSQ